MLLFAIFSHKCCNEKCPCCRKHTSSFSVRVHPILMSLRWRGFQSSLQRTSWPSYVVVDALCHNPDSFFAPILSISLNARCPTPQSRKTDLCGIANAASPSRILTSRFRSFLLCQAPAVCWRSEVRRLRPRRPVRQTHSARNAPKRRRVCQRQERTTR